MLKGTALEAGFPLQRLAMDTEGLSGSDLKEICRNAAMAPVREYMRQAGGDRDVLEKGSHEVSRQTTVETDSPSIFIVSFLLSINLKLFNSSVITRRRTPLSKGDINMLLLPTQLIYPFC